MQIAVGVVFALLETRSIDDLAEWTRALPPWAVDLVLERARDLEVVRTFSAAGTVPTEEDVDRWSDWVERRLSLESRSEQTLVMLARAGATRRVRNRASTRLEDSP